MKFFVPHKLKVGDITNLSDKDSRFIIDSQKLKEEDVIEIETLQKVFLAQITFIDTASVEIEILKVVSEKAIEREENIVLLQSTLTEGKFSLLLEKCVELGVDRLIPLETEFSLISTKDFNKLYKKWSSVIKDASEQSRNNAPTILERVHSLKEFESQLGEYKNYLKICFTTENSQPQKLSHILHNLLPNQKVIMAIGPERGWEHNELKNFKKAQFQFASMGDIILRTETAGIAAASIINFAKKVY